MCIWNKNIQLVSAMVVSHNIFESQMIIIMVIETLCLSQFA